MSTQVLLPRKIIRIYGKQAFPTNEESVFHFDKES